MSILSWFGVIFFAWLWIKDIIDERKFIKELRRGDYDDVPVNSDKPDIEFPGGQIYEQTNTFDGCPYRGSCLTDCTYRAECPYYSY